MKFFLKRIHNKKGFTLIELIVVIAILAILALIAIPRFGGFTEKARMRADEEYAESVAVAALVDYADNGAFPANVAALVAANLLPTYAVQSSYYTGPYTITGNTTTGIVTVTLTATTTPANDYETTK